MENVEFITGKVEDVINSITATIKDEEVIAVLDPPRAGVHSNVIKAIRGCSAINRLLFVACDAQNAMQNFIE